MPSIEVLRIGRLKTGHDLLQRNFDRLYGEVDVVVHEAVRQELEAELLTVVGDPIEVSRSVGIAAKNGLALVPTRDHMVKTAWNLDPQPPRHSSQIILKERTDPNQDPGAERRRRDLQHANPLAAALTVTEEAAVMIVMLERARAVALLRCTARDRVCRALVHRDRRHNADAARGLALVASRVTPRGRSFQRRGPC